MDEKGKFAVLLAYWKANENIAFVFWFEESLQKAATFFASQADKPVSLLTAREAATAQLGGHTPVFAEHYPLHNKEEDLFSRMNLQKATVFSALTDPLFSKFGGEKIIQLMQKLGMKEEEVIEHKMISRSIRQAQEKIAQKIVVEQNAQSQEDWFKKNLPS